MKTVDISNKTNNIYKMKPNQLRITVTDHKGEEISIIADLIAIQNMANAQGVKAVEATIFKMFNDTVDRMKNPPRV